MAEPLKVGDLVRWLNAPSFDHYNAVGKIIRILPVKGLPEFTLYDIQFEFGKGTLQRHQIEVAAEKTSQDFLVGDHVRWRNPRPLKYQNSIGKIIMILPGTGRSGSPLYAVQFQFGSEMLFANEMELVGSSIDALKGRQLVKSDDNFRENKE